MRKDNKYNHAGPSAEDRALEKFAEMMIEKISTLQSDWKKPWFTEGALTWPKNLSGREYNGMNAMMLMMHCEKEGFKLPVFCTFDRVVGLNYGKDKEGGKVQLTDAEGNELPKVSINKGSKSIPVFIILNLLLRFLVNTGEGGDEYRDGLASFVDGHLG